MLIACAFNYEAHATEFSKLGRIPVLKARMNADLHMAEDLKNTGKGNLFVIFGEPDIDLLPAERTARVRVKVNGVDVFHPSTGEVRSDGADGIACWFIDTDYNEESFFVRHAYFLGANDPYSALKTTLKAEINEDAWATLHSDTSRPFDKPKSGRIAVKVINHLGDEVMKVFTGLSARMEFRIADTFTDSLARLTGDEQKAVKTTAFDLQLNPASPGHAASTSSTRRRTRDFWSVRVEQRHPADRPQERRQPAALLRRSPRQGVRTGPSGASWRRIPTTGAAQLVEIRETVQEIVVPQYVAGQTRAQRRSRRCSAHVPDDELLGYGVPAEWLADVRQADEDTAARPWPTTCPAEAAEALLELATGGTPPRMPRAVRRRPADPFDHPDAQRRFRVMTERRGAGARARVSRGRSGRSSCIPRSGDWSSATTAAPRASPARPARGRPSWRCIAPSIWLARIPTRACC